ncbi:tetratricopeptide repeat protein [Ekhidna sp.]
MKTLALVSVLMASHLLCAQNFNEILDSALVIEDKKKALDYYISYQNQFSGVDKAHYLYGLGELHYSMRMPLDTVIKTYSLAHQKFQESEMDSMAFESLFEIASKVRRSGNRKRAVQYYLNAAEFAKKTDQRVLEGDALNSTGVNLYHQGEYVEALKYYLRANKIYEELEDPENIAKSYNNIGIIYKLFNNYELAIEYYQESLEIRKKNNLKNQTAPYFNLNELHHFIGDHRKALFYSNESLKAAREYDNKVWEIDVVISHIKDYQYLNEPDSMKLYVNLLFELIENDPSMVPTARKFLGIYYIEIGKSREAITALKEALDFFEKDSDIDQIELINSHIGDAYMQLRLYAKAIEYYYVALNMAIDENFSPMINLAMEKLHPALLASGKVEEAYHMLDSLRLREDSLFNESKASITGAMEARMNLIEEENRNTMLVKEAEIQSAQIANQRIIILLISSISIGLILVSILFVKQQKVKKKLAEKERELIASELDYKNQELINFAVQITQKNEFIKSLNEKIQSIENSDLVGIQEIVRANESITKDREEFDRYVQNVCEGFFAKLSDLYPEVTASEKRLAALLRLDLSSKEISTVLNISPKSVDMSRYRLRKKMNLEASANLSEALQSI